MESDFDARMHSLRTVSMREAGALLGIGKNKSYGLVKQGRYPVRVHQVAGKLRVRLSDLETLLGDANANDDPFYEPIVSDDGSGG